ncbi:MAG: AP endonuclease [Treponema sp.]|jgi:hypothetical protein|nr:AP endonuclease [Treponema sp.]
MMILTVPSWVIPGTYLENLVFLHRQAAGGCCSVRGVELLFFLYNREIQTLLDAEWEGIQAMGSRFTFTAHLPDPLLPVHADLVQRLLPLSRHCILHPGLPENAEALAALIGSWIKRFSPLFPPASLAAQGQEACPFLVENTLPGRLEALLAYLPDEAGLCMDTGHLLLEGKRPLAFYQDYGNRIREIHLHGVAWEQARIDGRLPDHRPLRAEERWFQELVPVLADFTGVVNLEVFSWEEVLESMAVLQAAGL